jgi:hypothetical protein
MKNKPSVAKKVASVVAGTALAASLYANAVYQPRNESALEQALDRELQAVVKGEAEVTLAGDGFVVVERAPVSAQDTSKLVEEIAQLESEMKSVSRDAAEKMAAAYKPGQATQLAQARPPRGAVGGLGGAGGGAGGALGITGFNVGATIGSLASVLSSPFITVAEVRAVQATFSPAQVAAAASSTAGISAAGSILAAGIADSKSAETIAGEIAVAVAVGGTVGALNSGSSLTSP